MRLLLLILSLALLVSVPAFSSEAPQIAVVSVNGPITPVTAEYLRRNLRESAQRGDRLLLMEMDTPGGLESAMRAIIKDIFASPVPVAVHVAPSGARAASAGAVIALAADVCVMAPGTNIGAAHPVAIGETPDKVMEKKMVNDAEAYIEGIALKRGRNTDIAKRMVAESISLPAEKALAENVIDLIATDQQDLLKKLEGRRIMRGGKEFPLALAGAVVKRHEMSMREKILDIISNPNVAYVLMMLGFLGLFFELSNPGVILPGVIGGISLLLAFFAFQTLPVNYAGVLLILLALILFIAEIKIVSHGMLTVGGVIAMVLGSLLLFQSSEPYLQLSWGIISITVVLTTIFFVFVVAKAVKAHRKKPVTGGEGLVGEEGVADSEVMDGGKVFVRGEYWDATSPERISKGERIIVTAVEGMRLRVRRIS
ncbi:MAG TPA: nodulation protein NfeD [Geobacteraceae bacterium]